MSVALARRDLLALAGALVLGCRNEAPAVPGFPALDRRFAPLCDDFEAERARVRVLSLLSPT